MPKISVIMPVYNEDIDDLDESIDSILKQTYKDFEYIIIDDNPENNQIKEFLNKKAKEDNRIRIIFNDKNLKLSKTENKAIELAKGSFIARMDADDIARKDRLESQLSFVMENNLDFTYSNFSIINNDGDLTRKYTYSKNDRVSQKIIKMLMSHRNVAIGPVFFFKKEVFNKLRGYRIMNSEDYDFVSRALIYGFKVGYQGKPLILKRLRMDSISFDTLYDQYILIQTIGNFLRKNNYEKIIPIELLNEKLNNISEHEKNKFNKFANARYTFNDHKTLKNFVKIIISIIFSITVLRYCVWSIFNKVID
ncbi:glycosyltransferase [Apilactobacillus bombintestini]|nr:glycosyltransferase [Apilactobacillus bombintestini]